MRRLSVGGRWISLHCSEERRKQGYGRMSRRSNRARKWTCDQCGVSASRIDGEPTPLPDAWTISPEGQYCLSCRRERAGNAALESAPSDSPNDTRAKLRRTALIEFEVHRAPDHSDGAIAKVCRTSAAAVAKARSRLQLPDPPSHGAGAKHREPVGR